MKCQRQILRIRWQDHVRNDEVAAHTGLRHVMESIRRRREAIFEHDDDDDDDYVGLTLG